MTTILKMTGVKMIGAATIALAFIQPLQAQKANWQNLDLSQDTVFGISTEKAYSTLLQNNKHLHSQPVIVAVIDGGVDTAHEDLRAVIWANPKEIPGNGVDDD